MNLIKNLFGKVKSVWYRFRKPSYPRLAKNVVRDIPMSPEDVRVALGLHDWNDYRRTVLERFASLDWIDGERNTGRTTKLMCDALSYATEGRSVCFVAKTKGDAKIARHKLIAYAKQLGIKQKIRVVHLSRVNRVARPANSKKDPVWTVVYDHYALGIE